MTREDKEILLDAAITGVEADKFLTSRIGKLITEKANRQGDAAIKALSNVDPNDAKAVRKIQDDLTIPAKVISWIREAIAEGYVCEKMLNKEEEVE